MQAAAPRESRMGDAYAVSPRVDVRAFARDRGSTHEKAGAADKRPRPVAPLKAVDIFFYVPEEFAPPFHIGQRPGDAIGLAAANDGDDIPPVKPAFDLHQLVHLVQVALYGRPHEEFRVGLPLPPLAFVHANLLNVGAGARKPRPFVLLPAALQQLAYRYAPNLAMNPATHRGN